MTKHEFVRKHPHLYQFGQVVWGLGIVFAAIVAASWFMAHLFIAADIPL